MLKEDYKNDSICHCLIIEPFVSGKICSELTQLKNVGVESDYQFPKYSSQLLVIVHGLENVHIYFIFPE